MQTLSPTLFSTTYGWPSENNSTQNHQQDFNDIYMDVEANSYNPLLDILSCDQSQQNSAPNSWSSRGATDGNTADPMKVSKKLNHNASERDRRKRVNELYEYLRSLLPISADQKVLEFR